MNRAGTAAALAAEQSREVQNQLAAMGACGAAERLTPVLDTIKDATARLAAGIAMTDEAIALATAAKGGSPASDSVTGRFTRPQEVADLVLLLASDRVGNVTCADFVIDGGLITTL